METEFQVHLNLASILEWVLHLPVRILIFISFSLLKSSMSFSITPKAEHQYCVSLLLQLVCAHVCASVCKIICSLLLLKTQQLFELHKMPMSEDNIKILVSI